MTTTTTTTVGADADVAATYIVGTVLFYPRSVTPFTPQLMIGPNDTSWFIVFKPCPVSLLRGVVPVGRVVSCVAGTVTAAGDSGDEPFDAEVLQSFQACCEVTMVPAGFRRRM